MKEIIAFIRSSKMNATKKILDELNVSSVTAIPVLGRGNQRGLNPVLAGIDISKDAIVKGNITGMKFVPKRMLVIVAKDEEVNLIVDALVKVNKTGFIGDGKIFVCPTDNAMRIRTKESGDTAL
ncbi:nitrogen regulatory protein P-II [Paludibacter propionicigenes WB4]|jgi:nitrogen regulatory protein PII 2|uniref:Nitrogen regulatory protein P-II n=1 Tax=Paludibacter propionicigenes (strain DSM 17365 / JCM 13257 / WB4) TaxID=694427 RepID=E4T466_PALPW|nr:P-II family nitrogen regulator [Paludibacter propionicigenes]ADQ79510.1 nitrogen regulatory protein P-II [Paludibacter propionicigenes WB4]